MRRTIATVATAALAIGAGLVLVGQAQAESPKADPTPDLELVRPSGDHPVGVTGLHLVDTERADPWVPDQDRELMVSVWYPARKGHGERAQYLTAAESEIYLERAEVDLPPDTLATVKTHARMDAKPAQGRKRPLVVLSPGWTQPRATLTGLAEDLASKGYIVAVIGHNHETVTEFPDGRVTTCEACGRNELDKAAQGRTEDASFVIDELTDRRGPWRGSKLIDRDRIAMAGHSLGGGASYAALRDDERIDAVVNIDGRTYEPGAYELDRPLLLLGSQRRVPGDPGDSWSDTWQHAEDWKRWITVEGTAHSSFTDIGLLGAQAGLEDPDQTLEPERCVELTREVVSAFFDTHLKGKHRPILNGPSADDPELVFHNP